MRKQYYAWLLAGAALGGLASTGCASGPRPIVSDTQLGKVIVYRNGVAYFERYAPAGEQAITLRVPTERVDDFLKSLTVTDEKSGKALPVSYPTIESYDGYVEMTIKLPESRGRLRITYVTESPAWKPSYRVVLSDEGDARLHGWAVVDNVSGEDWDKVRIGVGSTSALSFRYNLHSVRLVDRVTLQSGARLAGAPPTGGSPYAVATKKVRLLGSLNQGELDEMERIQTRTTAARGRSSGGGGKIQAEMHAPAPPADEAPALLQIFGGDDEDSAGASTGADRKKVAGKRRRDANYYRSLSKRLQAGNHHIRIEGYARHSDGDGDAASARRANNVKQQLVQLGVPAKNIEAIGTGRVSNKDAVRILETDDPVGQGQHDESGAEDTQPVGKAHFVSKHALSIEADHSAMVSIINSAAKATRVFYYDPVSTRGSDKYAFNAVRLENPSKYTLDAGPFTIYAAGQFLGEGLSEPILPGGTAFIPYALDRSVVAETAIAAREEIDSLVTIQRGVVTAESRRIRRTKRSFTNRGKQDAEIYVRHKTERGYELSAASKKARAKLSKLGTTDLFRVTVKAGETVELAIEEHTPLTKTVDIRTDRGVKAMALFLKASKLEAALESKLEAIITSHMASADLQERIALLDDQMGVYRSRVDEINVQLVTLRKVPQAAKLKRHLSSKMQEISDKLQSATMQMTDLKGQQMTLRIDLQDKLADLTLKKKDDPKEVASTK